MAVARYYDHNAGEWVLLAAGRDGASGASSWGDLTGKPSAYPPESHSHSQSEVEGLEAALDGKASVSHDHAIGQVTGLQSALDGKAPTSHGHTVAQVTGLQSALDGKAPADHQHSWDDLTGKPDTYPPETHTHTASQISDATTVGRNVLKASSQATARSAIGAGTSNLALGTTASTAAAGNHTHSEYATTAQVEARTPEIRTVSSPEQATSPGVLYVVMEG